ncbi:MAG: histidinol-phosphate transaminase [Planctomycetaceae bacterium]|nr:histidinol-phosphate transaminase [Planctomycetaceae bacterium]
MTLARPNIARIEGYVPGEQPQEAGWVKLNTNENPYPCSPRVVEAIERAARGRMNIYPDPVSTSFRRAVGELFDIDPDWVLPANGSDENLTILLRTFVDPGELVAYPYPSYILYETLADLQGGAHERLLLNADWSWDLEKVRERTDRNVCPTKLLFVPNPNSPSGNRWDDETICSLIPPQGLLVLDEAYGDFADEPHRMELLKGEYGSRIIVTRTLSKSYSLAGLRLGFAIAHPEHIEQMRKVKDSYNCDTLSLAAGTAAIQDQQWMLDNTAKIRATRSRLTAQLRELGFEVVDSQANFVWSTHTEHEHRTLYEQLKTRKVLVRFMQFPESKVDGLRITVGTDAEIDTLLDALQDIV